MPQPAKVASPLADTPIDGDRTLVTWGCQETETHENLSHAELARRTARLLRMTYGGRLEEFAGDCRPYCIPRDTLCGVECQERLGNVTEADFLGGWVSHSFMATKAIVHPLAPDERPPPGWTDAFALAVKDSTLTGFTALTREGAMRAGRILFELGDLRVKAVGASGGGQQYVVRNMRELSDVVDQFDSGSELRDSLVIEENLYDVRTYSVGRIRVGSSAAAYVGTQELTDNNNGEKVYGGSRLCLVRGGFQQITPSMWNELNEEEAICRLAFRFDELATRHLRLVASRRNYDIAVGVDGRERRKYAVLEQSWRVGGATGAEIAALEAFERRPELQQVKAATVERYGEGTVLPKEAAIYYQGVDPVVGAFVKYAILQDEF